MFTVDLLEIYSQNAFHVFFYNECILIFFILPYDKSSLTVNLCWNASQSSFVMILDVVVMETGCWMIFHQVLK